ncbi:zinc phosphodiesterase ELAC protein 2 isoform X4 [Plodia interpunctella]|uniref:zinc phosphodiesterase ELAC protein 2 isoform X4 n=1 Tax=Plodia interpunctella TaxID=58824 RepID=UPI00236890C6|nr:zinc phosphodiesterase ELAC protein 2 isoform X4 [Plodia interpunctella]
MSSKTVTISRRKVKKEKSGKVNLHIVLNLKMCLLSQYLNFSVVRLNSIRYKSGSSRSTKKLLDVLAEMPKANSARILDAQLQRQNISKKSEKYAPSTVYLQVLGSGARGAPNTLYVFTDQKRYLFNCGESTQRLAHEHKVKLSRLEHIFITSKTWTNIGGLPGLSLTLQDVGVPKLTLHGPEGLDELYQATKRFVIMKDMDVTMAECSPTADFEDNVMSVKYVILTPEILKPTAKKPRLEEKSKEVRDMKDFDKFMNDNTDYYKANSKPGYRRTRDHGKSRNDKDTTKTKDKQKEHSINKSTVAYICTLKKRLGTLDLAKCVELGVPPGPMLGQLKAGFDVVLPSGKLVLSKDVKTPDDPGPVFIVLEVPELCYLKETEFSAHFAETNPPERIPALVVHYTPPHVFKDPKYRQFLAMFGPDTKHLVLNSQNSCLGSEAVHRTQHKLHLLDPDIFPLLRDASVPAVWSSSPLLTESPAKIKTLEELKNKIAFAQFQNIINIEGSKGDSQSKPNSNEKYEVYEGRTLSVLHLRPKKEIDRSAEPKLHIQEYIQETMDIAGFTASLDTLRKQVDSIRYMQSDETEFPKVIFLGTGSCIPSKTRNTSGIVLQIDENRSMLLDCGEGTFGQLVRFFGSKRVNSFLRSVRAIYISHLHADHHIGLISVLQARRQAFKDHPTQECHSPYEPVHLLAPGQIMSWLNMYDLQFEKIRHDFNLIPNQSLLHTQQSEEEMTAAAIASIGVERIRTCLVSHCPNAFGVAIDVDQDNKITYSGDTIPCQELVKIGEKSTLLIHEATMEDELADEARTKMHSTTSQAIDMGRSMRAQYTVLTHFSQRYARLPRLNANILSDNRNVGIAFDNMQITMSDLQLLPLMYAPLLLMFAEHCVEMEAKAAQRARHRELLVDAAAVHSVGSHRSFRGRSNSSRCRDSTPTHSPSANYRERLRQKAKGMTIAGLVRGPRSSSVSEQSTTRSRASSLHSDGGARRSVRSSETCSNKSYDAGETVRTLSETSSNQRPRSRPDSASITKLNRCKLRGDKSPTNSERMVVVSSVARSRGNSPTASTRNSVHSAVLSTYDKGKMAESAYGKPLVTNINKRLKIMRYTPTPILFNNKDMAKMKPAPPPVRSPVRSTLKSSLHNEKEIIKSKQNYSWTPESNRSIKTCSRESSQSSGFHKKPESKSRIPTRCTPSGNKLRQSLTNPSIKYDKKNPIADRPESAKALRPYPRSPSRHDVDHVNYNGEQLSVMNAKSQLVKSPDRRGVAKDPSKKFEPVRDIVTERLKQPLCKRQTSPMQIGRPHSGLYNNRSYKPQLEDIKSSFLLLNKQAREQKQKTLAIEDDKNKSAVVKKPPAINNEDRRKQLIEVKKKFRSRSFFIDSKYDKIEGLNWISWK